MSSKDNNTSSSKEVVVIDDPLVTILTYPELLERREYLVHRLDQLTIPLPKKHHAASASALNPQQQQTPTTKRGGRKKAASKTNDDEEDPTTTVSESTSAIPYKAKTDTHFDYLLKEMQWLSTDFGSERKRHDASRRKICASIRTYFGSLEKRRVKLLTDAEVRRRKLASKIGRECVKSWWNKLEKIVTYKQKVSLEQSRRDAMNAQLVKLVKQTELYSRSLGHRDGDGNGSVRQGRDRSVSIEEALASAAHRTQRKAKGLIRDYSRFASKSAVTDEDDHDGNETGTDRETAAAAAASNLLYGESTEDSGSDASYCPSSTDEDETTLQEAELEEQALDPSRRQLEVQKLREEEEMDIERVLERLRNEAMDATQSDDAKEDNSKEDDEMDRDGAVAAAPAAASGKRVQFAASVGTSQSASPQHGSLPDPGEDADDDGDASEVEDYRDHEEEDGGSDDDDDDAEFVMDDQLQQIDDETTIALEESLPQEMSKDEEIRLLQAENELSIEELRARYAAALEADSQPGEDDDPSDASSYGDALMEEEEESAASDREDARSSSLSSLLFQPTDDSGGGAGGAEEDFVPDAEPDVDDETTMEAEERLGRDMSYEEEIALLQRESEMSIDELRAMYANAGANADENDDAMEDVESTTDGDHDPTAENEHERSYFDDSNDQENDDDFVPAEVEKDDETTIEAEERLGRDMSVEEEIALLQKEGEEPIEVLRERCLALVSNSKRKRDEEEEAGESDSAAEDEGDDDGLQLQEASADAGKAALDAIDASAMRARNTRATRPYLLAPWVRLREYQQVGLNWLVRTALHRAFLINCLKALIPCHF
jgi:HSA